MATMQMNRRLNASKLSTKSSRPSSVRSRLVCRAEEKSVVKSERPKESLTFPTLASKSTLTYLDGSLPGDFGFDPLGLTDPANSGGFVNPQWLQYSEIIHARWAMLGAAGCIAPEVLARFQPGFPEATNVVWFASGVIPPAGGYKDYWTDSVSLFFVEAVLMNFAELKRLQDFRHPGSQGKQYFLGLEKVLGGSGNPAYPGGQWFNLLNLGKTEAEMNKLKLNEIMNGRLAMLAMFGYGAQAVITRQGPFQNLLDHLEDPVGNNLLTNFGKVFGA